MISIANNPQTSKGVGVRVELFADVVKGSLLKDFERAITWLKYMFIQESLAA